MSTDVIEMTELELFQRFVERTLKNGGRKTPLAECVTEFRAYQDEVARFRREIQTAMEQSERGESEPLDIEDVIERGMQRWSSKQAE